MKSIAKRFCGYDAETYLKLPACIYRRILRGSSASFSSTRDVGGNFRVKFNGATNCRMILPFFFQNVGKNFQRRVWKSLDNSERVNYSGSEIFRSPRVVLSLPLSQTRFRGQHVFPHSSRKRVRRRRIGSRARTRLCAGDVRKNVKKTKKFRKEFKKRWIVSSLYRILRNLCAFFTLSNTYYTTSRCVRVFFSSFQTSFTTFVFSKTTVL